MGGLSTLRRWFQANGCGEAFHTGLPELPAGSVYISDDLTRMHRFRGPASGFLTGRQFFEQWQQGVMHQLKTGVIKVYIAVYDNATLVPTEKDTEQARRRAGKKPYPKDSVISDHGIRLPGSATYAPFDVNRVLSSTELRPTLYKYILTKLKSLLLPKGTAVIFDYNCCGPYLFRDGKRTLIECRREHGEADLQCAWWLTQIGSVPALISSIDSDFMVILTWFQHVRPRPHTYLQYEGEAYMDMLTFTRCVKERLRPPSMKQFVRACCCCGNDFVNRGALFYFLTEPKIMAQLSNSSDAEELVRHVYSQELTGDPNAIDIERARELCLRDHTRFGPPPEDNAEVWDMIEFNVRYWAVPWKDAKPVLEELFK